MSESEQFPKIHRYEFNRKAFKKRYRDDFETFAYKCRISKSKTQWAKYRADIKEIIQLVDRALDKDITYEIGNIYYILGMLEELKSFMTKVSQRANTVGNHSICLLYDTVDDKLDQVKKDLTENLHSPVSSNELRTAIESENGS